MLVLVYRTSAFSIGDPTPVLRGMLDGVAATMVTVGPNGMASTILPLLLDTATSGDEPSGIGADTSPGLGHGTLRGHVARGNPVVADAHAGQALVVVTGAQGYVSPGWYPSKAEHGRVVPTWDYVTVEAAGPLILHDDPAWVLDVVTRLTDRHEADQPRPWAVTDAPDEFVTAKLRAIVGIEIPITRLAAKAKLSQNRPAADVAGVLAGLRAQPDAASHALADAVARANHVT